MVAPEHVDVLIVGAGLSGIGAAYRLQTKLPAKTYAILESREAIGGTWDLFRYPGVRSDSDMFTLGYPFRPWKNPASIADGPSILSYIRDTAAAYGIDQRIRFRQRVIGAAWSTPAARWTVEISSDGVPTVMTCSFLYVCSGYYSYAGGHVVDFPGRDRFAGPVIHPQQWPEDLDYRGKRVVVIGSGATAVTLLPAMAADAEHVTMVQRSPSYVVALPGRDPIADRLRALLPERTAHRLIRGKNVVFGTAFYQLCRRFPDRMAKFLRDGAAKQLPSEIPVDPHFRPQYNPWDQRLCLAPNADIFKALSSGKASVVTDRITTFTERGVRVAGGGEIPADIIVTATGLKMVAFGMPITVDGEPVDAGQHLVYKGMMLSGVPNIAWCIGYTNASWTLRSDLTSLAVCRLLRHMDRHHYAIATPHLAPDDPAQAHVRPAVDLSSGYIQRAVSILPKQGARTPWMVHQNYLRDLAITRLGRVADGTMRFARTRSAANATAGS
ncbi:MAG TPA: NAD(P)/FAD-dependent oxidoreductase [Micromonosporaceae bacterium]